MLLESPQAIWHGGGGVSCLSFEAEVEALVPDDVDGAQQALGLRTREKEK